MPDEIKFGSIHYKRDSKGFWIAQFPTDPTTATITSLELADILKEGLIKAKELIQKLQQRSKELETDIASLETKKEEYP